VRVACSESGSHGHVAAARAGARRRPPAAGHVPCPCPCRAMCRLPLVRAPPRAVLAPLAACLGSLTSFARGQRDARAGVPQVTRGARAAAGMTCSRVAGGPACPMLNRLLARVPVDRHCRARPDNRQHPGPARARAITAAHGGAMDFHSVCPRKVIPVPFSVMCARPCEMARLGCMHAAGGSVATGNTPPGLTAAATPASVSNTAPRRAPPRSANSVYKR
jgi:hypothetical protein